VNSYGYMYIRSFQAMPEDIIDQIWKALNITSEDDLSFDAVYQQAIAVFRKLMHREPTKEDIEGLYSPARERFRSLSKKIKAERQGDLIKYSHPLFSIENLSEVARKVSAIYPNMHVCSVAGFDHSAFQLHIYVDGQTETVHQIGEELEDMGLSIIHGYAYYIKSFFHVADDTVNHFLEIEDVLNAEEYFFMNLIQT